MALSYQVYLVANVKPQEGIGGLFIMTRVPRNVEVRTESAALSLVYTRRRTTAGHYKKGDVYRMLKKEFVNVLQKKLDGYTKKQCEIIVDAFTDSIKDVLASGEDIKLTNFGVFRLRELKAHDVVEPYNKETVHVGTMKIPSLKFSNKFRDAIISEMRDK
ncbi:MAG: HU family DNA-binding protein [Lachnospiraceae bacterium]|nr:HU family DNA-binding protein [Lachnospiraceae bacterium]